MMKMRIILLTLLPFFIGIILLFSLSVQVNAVTVTPPVPAPTIEYALPYPGILPTHPLYTIKEWRDKILIWFAREPLHKANLYLHLSDKRVVMGQLLWDQKLTEEALNIFEDSQLHFLKGTAELLTIKREQPLPPGVVDKFELAGKKHEEIIQKLMLSAPSEYTERFSSILAVNHQALQQLTTLK